MKLKRSVGLIAFLLILQACSSLRTELYREETLHLYQASCKLYKQGDYEAAQTGFAKVIAFDPEYGPAHAALGNLALIGEDYSGAMVHYQEAVAADPELEAELRSLIMVASAHNERVPLQKSGIGLNQIYPLIMADHRVEVETLLAKDIPLQLLANDTMGITPGRLGELQRKIAETADPLNGSVRYRLFLGYLLFSGENGDALATAMINSAADGAADRDRQDALVVLGQLYERQGEASKAVDAYLAAVAAGQPMTDVAHHLARVYKVDIASVLPPKEVPAEGSGPPEPIRIEISTHLPGSPAPELGLLTEAKDIPMIEHQGSRSTF